MPEILIYVFTLGKFKFSLIDINLIPVVTNITAIAVYSNCIFRFTNIRNIMTPMKLATA